jgi:hypothetical protein
MNKSKRLDELVAGVDEILARLPDSSHPEVMALRDRVDAEILDAWTTISRQRARRQKRPHYAARQPWAIAGLALFAASLLANRLALSRTLKHR